MSDRNRGRSRSRGRTRSRSLVASPDQRYSIPSGSPPVLRNRTPSGSPPDPRYRTPSGSPPILRNRGRTNSCTPPGSPDPRIAEFEAKVRPLELFAQRCQASDGTALETLLQDCGVPSDPLKPWQDYVQYNRTNNYPQPEFQLLQRCVRSCIFIPQYKNDLEFLKFFILYTKTCREHDQDPLEEFELAWNCRFGKDMALFWIGWAWFAAKAEKYQLTWNIFDMSLQYVHGDAFTRVNAKFDSFKARMKRLGIELSPLREDDCRRGKRSRSRSRSKQPTKKQNSNIMNVENETIYTTDQGMRI